MGKSEIAYSMIDPLRHMFEQESTYNLIYDIEQLSTFNSMLDQHKVWRCMICEWCYSVVDHFQVNREIVAFAMDYFDRLVIMGAVSSSQSNGRMGSRDYQLVAATCLFVATKLHSDCKLDSSGKRSKPTINLNSLTKLSKGQFTADDIIDAEKHLLHSLDWMVNPVTPLSFVNHMLAFLDSLTETKPPHWDQIINTIQESSGYLTELAICLPEIISFKVDPTNDSKAVAQKLYSSSHIAFTSILISMEMFTYEVLPLALRYSFIKSIIKGYAEAPRSHASVLPLVPDNEHIQHLKSILHREFEPEVVWDLSTLGNQYPNCFVQEGSTCTYPTVSLSNEDNEEEFERNAETSIRLQKDCQIYTY